MDSSIFKSYDVRGVYPDPLGDEIAFEVGRGFVKHTKAKSVIVGHDARLSSPALYEGLIKGILSQGADVYKIGMTPTEGVYFALGNYDFDAGVMVTASHNPKEYNGFKMMVKKGGDIEMVRGKDLLSTIEQGGYEEGSPGKVFERDIWKDYIGYTLTFLKSTVRPFSVAIDASNGVMGPVLEKIKDRLPIKIFSVNFTPDGNFSNHSPNPLEKGSSDQISEKIQQEKADFGIMFDGDADRIFLVDEQGQLVSADITLLLMAKYFLKDNPGTAIIYNAICSKAVPEFVKKWGGVPVRTQVGFVNVREGLMQNGGVMGGELSGHYCFRDYWYMDSGMLTFLTLLQILSQEDKKISELVRELSPYFKSAEINFKIDDKEAVLAKIKEQYKDGSQDFLDGVTVAYKDWWFNVRPSNTEPLLRLTIEADTQDLLEQKKKELTDAIQ